jgi:hypothetical protein
MSLLFCGALWTIAAVNGSSGRARRRVTGFVCVTTMAVVLLMVINVSLGLGCRIPTRPASTVSLGL